MRLGCGDHERLDKMWCLLLLMQWRPRTDRLNMVATSRRSFSVDDALCFVAIPHGDNRFAQVEDRPLHKLSIEE